MYCIGLTGTIASGKSTVANYFTTLGIEVINADQVARELTAQNQPAWAEIVQKFGESILLSSGEIDRRQLRQFIFTQPELRQWLEQLLHPLIRAQIKTLIDQCLSTYCVIEIPLLVARSDYPYLNRVLLVTADQKTQMARMMHRDQCSHADALAILAAQPSTEVYRAVADDILSNHGNIRVLQQKVLELHQHYLHNITQT